MFCLCFGIGLIQARGNSTNRVLRVGSNVSEEHPSNQSLLFMGEIISEKTEGRISFKLFPLSTLGTEGEMIEQLSNGSLDLMKGGGYLGTFYKPYQAISLPYLFDDDQHFYRVMEDPQVREVLFEGSKDEGFFSLDYLDKGSRSFYTIDQPIISPSDLKGLKMRVMNDKVSVRMLELLGGNPVPLAYSEVYTALQQGVIDGAESDETVLTTGRHGEVAKVWSSDNHFRLPDYITVSITLWDSLSAEDQALFIEAAAEAREHQKISWAEAIDKAVDEAQSELGVSFYETDIASFQKAVEPMISEFAAEDAQSKQLIDRIEQLR